MCNPQDKSQSARKPQTLLLPERARTFSLCPKHTSLLSDNETSLQTEYGFVLFSFFISVALSSSKPLFFPPKISPPDTNHSPTPLHCSDTSKLKTKAAVDALDDRKRDGGVQIDSWLEFQSTTLSANSFHQPQDKPLVCCPNSACQALR